MISPLHIHKQVAQYYQRMIKQFTHNIYNLYQGDSGEEGLLTSLCTSAKREVEVAL
jgi:hypothetical protein